MWIPSRRNFVLSTAAAAIGSAGCVAWAEPSDPLQAWVDAHAIRIRTIDLADLEPLGDAIGSSSVVQLGEPSHGAGAAFAAKARLVRFLHRRLGFDVLVWESGMYDVALADAAMCSADNAVAAARKGIFALWSESAEVKPLFEYIKASHATLHPLEMAGFDMQVTADGSRERFAEDLRAFMGVLRNPGSRAFALPAVDQAISARERLFATKFANVDDFDSLTAAAARLYAVIGADHADLERVWSRQYIAFMHRALSNAVDDASLRFDAAKSPATTPEREGRRDSANADNLRWLIEERYAGRKVIVWAHNAHVMNAYYAPGFHDIHLDPAPGDMKPMGVFLKEWLRDKIYTLGMTGYAGQEGFATGGPVTAIPPASDGSLEAHLHALGASHAFLDFRASKNDPRNPLRALVTVRIPKFESVTLSDVSRVYDGLFFIDRISPATHV